MAVVVVAASMVAMSLTSVVSADTTHREVASFEIDEENEATTVGFSRSAVDAASRGPAAPYVPSFTRLAGDSQASDTSGDGYVTVMLLFILGVVLFSILGSAAGNNGRGRSGGSPPGDGDGGGGGSSGGGFGAGDGGGGGGGG